MTTAQNACQAAAPLTVAENRRVFAALICAHEGRISDLEAIAADPRIRAHILDVAAGDSEAARWPWTQTAAHICRSVAARIAAEEALRECGP